MSSYSLDEKAPQIVLSLSALEIHMLRGRMGRSSKARKARPGERAMENITSQQPGLSTTARQSTYFAGSFHVVKWAQRDAGRKPNIKGGEKGCDWPRLQYDIRIRHVASSPIYTKKPRTHWSPEPTPNEAPAPSAKSQVLVSSGHFFEELPDTETDQAAEPRQRGLPARSIGQLSQFHEYRKAARIDDAIDEVFRYFDEQFTARLFRECDETLTTLSIEEFGTDLIIAVLTATLPAREQLNRRTDFVQRAEHVLLETEQEGHVQDLLRGLR